MNVDTYTLLRCKHHIVQYYCLDIKPRWVCLQARYPPLPHKWTLCLTLHPLHHVQSAQDVVAGAITGISIGSMLHHSILAAELLTDYTTPSWQSHVGLCLSVHSSAEHHRCCSCCCLAMVATCASSQGQCAESVGGSVHGTEDVELLQKPSAACADTCGGCTASNTNTVWSGCACSALCAGRTGNMAERHGPTDCRCKRGALGVHQAAASRAQHVSPAAAAAMQTCSRLAPEVKWVVVHVYLDNHMASRLPLQHSVIACQPSDVILPCGRGKQGAEEQDRCTYTQQNLQEVLMDDEWMVLEEALAVVLDVQGQQMAKEKEQCCWQVCSEAGLGMSCGVAGWRDPVRLVNGGDEAKWEQCLAGMQAVLESQQACSFWISMACVLLCASEATWLSTGCNHVRYAMELPHRSCC